MKTLKIAIPKGSLQEATFALFGRAGFNISVQERSYMLDIDDPELEGVMLRAQEIASYVERGALGLDAGLTGKDWILENGAKVKEIAELPYAKRGAGRVVRWVLAVPEASKIRKVEDLNGGHVATELVAVTKKFFAARKIKVSVEFSWGTTELKAYTADAIVEVTETGSSLRAHNLREVATILESTPRLIANRSALMDPWKKKKIENLSLLLCGALEAEDKVGLKMNLPKKAKDALFAILPSMKNPTVSTLTDERWLAVEVVVSEKIVRDLIPRLKEAGACDIIEYKLTKVID